MDKQTITAPGVYQPPHFAQAIRVGNVLYTAGILGRETSGNLVGKGDLEAQAHKAYLNLGAILRAADAQWKDVARFNIYLARPEDWEKAWDIHRQYLPPYQSAGSMVVAPLVDAEALIEVELVAHIGRPRRCITNVPNASIPEDLPHAVEVDGALYLTGQQAPKWDRSDVTHQTEVVYRGLGAVLTACNSSWKQILFIHNYLVRNDVLKPHHDARYKYISRGSAAMSSVVCGLTEADSVLQTELISTLNAKQTFEVSGVPVSPGVAHAAKAGNTVYVQGQVARDVDWNLVGEKDPGAQAEQVYKNLNLILKAAGADWHDVVKVKSYHTIREDIAEMRSVREQYLRKGTYVSTAIMAGFFYPGYRMEVELVAVTA